MLALSAALAIGASDFVWGRFILQDVSFGLVTGGVVGFVAAKLMPTGREHEAASHQKSLYALGIALATYGIAVLPPSGNGLIAVFVCAITLGILRPDIRDCFAAERRLPTTSASHRRAAMLCIGRPVRAGPGASTSSTWSGTPALLTPTIGLRSRRKSSAVGRRAAPGWWTPSGGRPARNSSRRSRGPIKSWMDIRRQVEDLAELAAGLRSALPRGQTLPEHAWRRRHRVILGLLWLHSVGLPIYGVARGYGIGHSLLEGAAVGVIAMLAIVQPWGRRGASALVSIGLISSSAILVHLSAGTIEAHFHFFVMIAVVALYEDWIPFLIAFAYVAVHHAVVGTLFPASVFSHPAAVANPLRWALIHAVFVFAAAIAAITGWRLNESVRAEAVRAQEELQESERELTEAQALAHLGSWTWDLGSNDVTWSPELYRLLGFHPGSRGANYERFFEAVHPDDRQALEQKLSHSISTGERFAHHLRIVRPDGTERILLSQGEVVEATHDHPRTMVNTLQDVTERKRAEESLTRLNLQQASILNSAGDGIHGIDGEGRIIFANPAAAALSGYADEEVVGRRQHDLVHHSKPDGSPYPYGESPIVQALRDAMPHHAADDLFWRKDGSSFPVEYTATPIRENGEVRGAVVVFRDITERREVDRLKAEFTSVVSHELRTPLTSIRGSLGLLAGGVLGPLPATGQRMLDIAVANTDRLVRLINDILDIERIESGQAPLQQREVGAADILGQAVELLDGVAREAGIALVARPIDAKLWADPDRLTQTLTNLISNAIKFSPPGTTVSVTARRSGAEILFTVADQGRGIPQGKLEMIFERFQQVDGSDAREKGGTGLGLAICRSIVEQHGGRMWAESAPGQGATLSFTLPAPTEHEPIAGGGTGPGALADDAPSELRVIGELHPA